MVRLNRISTLTLLVVTTLAFNTFAEDALNESRSTIEKWVETRQLLSKTRSDWQTDKDTLEQTVALYERELKAIDEQIKLIKDVSIVESSVPEIQKFMADMATQITLGKLSSQAYQPVSEGQALKA